MQSNFEKLQNHIIEQIKNDIQRDKVNEFFEQHREIHEHIIIKICEKNMTHKVNILLYLNLALLKLRQGSICKQYKFKKELEQWLVQIYQNIEQGQNALKVQIGPSEFKNFKKKIQRFNRNIGIFLEESLKQQQNIFLKAFQYYAIFITIVGYFLQFFVPQIQKNLYDTEAWTPWLIMHRTILIAEIILFIPFVIYQKCAQYFRIKRLVPRNQIIQKMKSFNFNDPEDIMT